MRIKRHMSLNIEGAMRFNKSLKGFLIDDNGKELSHKDVKKEFLSYLKEGKKILPMCDPEECPNFDYTGGGCPGHQVIEDN